MHAKYENLTADMHRAPSCPFYSQDGAAKSKINMQIRASKKVIKCVFTHNMFHNLHVR